MRQAHSLLAATLMLAGTLAGAAPVLAADPQGATPAHETRHRTWGSRFQQRLGLTDDQMQQLRQSWETNAPVLRQHFQKLRQVREELRRLILDNADQNQIETKQMQLQQLYAQGVELQVQRLQNLAVILTPEQKVKLQEVMAERAHRFRHRGHRHYREPQSPS